MGRVFANEDEAAIVRRAYGDFFLRDIMDVAVRDVPHSLRHIFHLLRFVKSCRYKLFSNGAGKHFLSALLGISCISSSEKTGAPYTLQRMIRGQIGAGSRREEGQVCRG